ncbi:hypothetical protein AAFF_G00180890 [Aldrovandia affinis]|uniref:Uncharacterized protein n=1 Tax=Aldrovandia affinis TaxID=143900 RepID=A0AAD7SYD4_9TELE|nr:hypothetical protein AAFF_G00180890 [Aldrovandia affinis]
MRDSIGMRVTQSAASDRRHGPKAARRRTFRRIAEARREGTETGSENTACLKRTRISRLHVPPRTTLSRGVMVKATCSQQQMAGGRGRRGTRPVAPPTAAARQRCGRRNRKSPYVATAALQSSAQNAPPEVTGQCGVLSLLPTLREHFLQGL